MSRTAMRCLGLLCLVFLGTRVSADVTVGDGNNGGNANVSCEIEEPVSWSDNYNGNGGRQITFTLRICCENCDGCESPDVCGIRLKRCKFKVNVLGLSGGSGGWSRSFIVGGAGSETGQSQYTVCQECGRFTITAFWHGSGAAAPSQIKIEELEAECVCCHTDGETVLVTTLSANWTLPAEQTRDFATNPGGTTPGVPIDWEDDDGPIPGTDSGVTCTKDPP